MITPPPNRALAPCFFGIGLRRCSCLALAVMVGCALPGCSKKTDRDPVPPISARNPKRVSAVKPAKRPPAPAFPANVLSTGFDGIRAEIECDNPGLAQAVADALTHSRLWRIYTRDRHDLRRVGEPPLAHLQLRLSTQSGKPLRDGATLRARVDSIEATPGLLRCAVTATASPEPSMRSGGYDAALFADELATALITGDHPAIWRLERHILALAQQPPPGAARVECVWRCVQALALAGCFDSAVAVISHDEARARGEQKVTLHGKDHLVEQARVILARQPLWTLWFVVDGSPLEISLEARHEIHKLAEVPGYNIFPGNYDPGTGYARVIIRNAAGTVLHDARTTGPTPGSVYVGESPYLHAEAEAVRRNLIQAGAWLTDRMPADPLHVILLVAEVGALWGEGPRDEHARKVLLEVLRRYPAGLDTVVSGLGSRTGRTNDCCVRILETCGFAGTEAMVRGLLHPVGAVRSRCATELRRIEQGRFSTHLEALVQSAIETLNDDAYADYWGQFAFLLRDIGPPAAAAIPALQRMEKFSRLDGRYATEAIKSIQRETTAY